MADQQAKLQRTKKYLREKRDEFADPDDVDHILEAIDAYDPDNVVYQCPDDQKTKSKQSLINVIRSCEKVAREHPLTTTDTHELNQAFQSMRDGDYPGVKDGGLTNGTVRGHQLNVRQFLYYHDDAEAEPTDISLFKADSPAVDPADMLDREEIIAYRNASLCLRDTAVVDFMLYAGQRNTATRTLRIRDLDLDESRFKLNDSINGEGLKDADEHGKWRDLLMSEATIRQWLNNGHLCPDEPDAYVFHGRPKYGDVDPFEPLSKQAITDIFSRIRPRAIESCPSLKTKPTNPHAMRHNFVTIALRRGMPESAIKHQIGHAPGSRVMETTYAHLKDDDHIKAAREAFGLEVEDEPNKLTPEFCPRCGATVHDTHSMCGVCGLKFSPDAAELSKELDDEIYEQKAEAEGKEEAGVDVIRDILNNDPDAKAALFNEMKDELLAELRDEL